MRCASRSEVDASDAELYAPRTDGVAVNRPQPGADEVALDAHPHDGGEANRSRVLGIDVTGWQPRHESPPAPARLDLTAPPSVQRSDFDARSTARN
jgi:hypothetical protein